MRTIETHITEVLKAAAIDGQYVRLTGQLSRKTYEQVNEVLTRIGGKWTSGKVKAHVFSEDPRPLLEDVIATGKMPAKNPLAYFATPPSIARMMVNMALVSATDRVLEPSAGEGGICDVVRAVQPDAAIQAVELDAKRAALLGTKGYAVECADFLLWETPDTYTAVLMNPPFAVDRDPLAYITHIEHAWRYVAQYGILCAIAPSGFTYRSDRRSAAFRALVSEHGDWADLPDGSFSASGTGVDTVIILMRK